MALFLFTNNIIEDKPIDVFNYGNHRRDFTYVDDIVEGVIRTMDHTATANDDWNPAEPDPGTSSAPYRIYNIGNQRPVELMRERGIMGPDTIAFHCVFLSQRDIEIFAETGTKLSHTAYHVAKRGYFPPMEAVYAAEVDVSLGSDWCSNDLWNFMRAAILIPRARSGDVGMLSGYDALELATGGGARGLGLAHEIGSLEPGKKADIILVDVDTPWCRPLRTENLAANLVFNAQGGDVTDVFVDGRRIVQDRIIKTIDQAAVLAEVQVRAEKIWSAAAETWT